MSKRSFADADNRPWVVKIDLGVVERYDDRENVPLLGALPMGELTRFPVFFRLLADACREQREARGLDEQDFRQLFIKSESDDEPERLRTDVYEAASEALAAALEWFYPEPGDDDDPPVESPGAGAQSMS